VLSTHPGWLLCASNTHPLNVCAARLDEAWVTARIVTLISIWHYIALPESFENCAPKFTDVFFDDAPSTPKRFVYAGRFPGPSLTSLVSFPLLER